MTGSLNPTFHRETVLVSGVGDERVVLQHGSTGVYAGIRVEVRSLTRGKGTVFAWNAGANIPARFATAVAQGARDAISKGILADSHHPRICMQGIIDGLSLIHNVPDSISKQLGIIGDGVVA